MRECIVYNQRYDRLSKNADERDKIIGLFLAENFTILFRRFDSLCQSISIFTFFRYYAIKKDLVDMESRQHRILQPNEVRISFMLF